MAHITSLFMLHTLLLLVSFSITTTKGNDNLITSVCSKAKTVDPSFCNKVLRADPRSAKADLKGLGFVSLDVASTTAHKYNGLMGSLLKSTTEPKLKNRYKACAENYDDCIESLGEAKQALTKGDIGTFRIRASAARDGPGTCEDGFEGNPGMPPELRQAIKETGSLCSIVLAIGALLNGE